MKDIINYITSILFIMLKPGKHIKYASNRNTNLTTLIFGTTTIFWGLFTLISLFKVPPAQPTSETIVYSLFRKSLSHDTAIYYRYTDVLNLVNYMDSVKYFKKIIIISLTITQILPMFLAAQTSPIN